MPFFASTQISCVINCPQRSLICLIDKTQTWWFVRQHHWKTASLRPSNTPKCKLKAKQMEAIQQISQKRREEWVTKERRVKEPLEEEEKQRAQEPANWVLCHLAGCLVHLWFCSAFLSRPLQATEGSESHKRAGVCVCVRVLEGLYLNRGMFMHPCLLRPTALPLGTACMTIYCCSSFCCCHSLLTFWS